LAWPKWIRRIPGVLPRYVTSESGKFFPSLNLGRPTYDLSKTPEGRKEMVQAIYSMLVQSNLAYAEPEYHDNEKEQIVRDPREIKSQGLGTCLDLAALFCGLCLFHGLLPMLIVTKGHAFAAVSLSHRGSEWEDYRKEYALFSRGPLKDPNELWALIEDESWLAVECTGFARSLTMEGPEPESQCRNAGGVMAFEDALRAGQAQLQYQDRLGEGEFYAFDIILEQKKGAAPYPLEYAGNHTVRKIALGPTVHKMCDREQQVCHSKAFFEEKIQSHKPIFYVIHGGKNEAHLSLCEILTNILAEIIENQSKREGQGESHSAPPSLEPVTWPAGGDLETRKIILARKPYYSESTKREDNYAVTSDLPKTFANYSLVTFRLVIDASDWESKDIDLLRWYVKEFWGDPDLQNKVPAQIVIFIIIKYEENGHRLWLRKWLGKNHGEKIIERLKQECVNGNCSFMVLEKLSPAVPQDLENWLNFVFAQQQAESKSCTHLIETIFPDKSPKPMEEVEEKLRQFVQECNKQLSEKGFIDFQ
jgi:hypothetical protein